MDEINRFINGKSYELLLRNILQKRNIEIESNIPFVLLDYDKEQLKAAQIEVENLETLLISNMTEIVSFVERKMSYDFEDEEEYPKGEELSDDEKPKRITELPYYKNFLVAFLIEYYLLKEHPTALCGYLKRIDIANATKYERELKAIWQDVIKT
jgi:hypothetical protein